MDSIFFALTREGFSIHIKLVCMKLYKKTPVIRGFVFVYKFVSYEIFSTRLRE